MKTNIKLDTTKHNNFNPIISIVVPIYNVEQYLVRCIESLINQTYAFIEIILVNDESPDNSASICEEYAKKDSRIQVIHKINGGLSDARNVGMKNSNGQYILFVDSDDYIELNTCERFINEISNKTPDLVVGNANRIEKNRTLLMKHTCVTKGEMITGGEYLKQELRNRTMHMAAWLTLYNTKFLKENNLEFKVGLLHEDEQFSPRVFLKAKKVIGTDIIFYNYIIRENSITTSNNLVRNAEDISKTCYELEAIIDNIEDRELKYLMRDNLVNKLLNIFQVAKLYKSKNTINIINKKFLWKMAYSSRNKLRVLLFIGTPNGYYWLNRLIKKIR